MLIDEAEIPTAISLVKGTCKHREERLRSLSGEPARNSFDA
jgi:uncharacterized protein YaaQ